MTFNEFIVNTVTEEKVLIEDGECIDEVNDYKDVIINLLALSDSELSLDSFYGEENEQVKLSVTINTKKHSFVVSEDTRWLEDKNLVTGLNELLEELKPGYRFYRFWSADSFGQEVGFFYASRETGFKIIDYAKKHNQHITEYHKLYTISDGTDEEGYQDL